MKTRWFNWHLPHKNEVVYYSTMVTLFNRIADQVLINRILVLIAIGLGVYNAFN